MFSESTLGIKVKAQEHDTHPFLQAFENCMEHITYRMKSPWLHNDFIYHLTPSCRHLTKSKNYLLDFIEQVSTGLLWISYYIIFCYHFYHCVKMISFLFKIIYEKRKEKAMEENIAKNSEGMFVLTYFINYFVSLFESKQQLYYLNIKL